MSFKDEFTDTIKEGLTPLQRQVKEVLNYLKRFVKNPIKTIKHPPNWPWEVLLVVFTGAAAACGVLSGLISLRVSSVLVGLTFFPISACVGAFTLSAFLYYTLQFVFKVHTTLKLIFTIVILALLPFFALYAFADLLSPIKLVGFAATSFLLVVGLSENTTVSRNKLSVVVIVLFVAYLFFWGVGRVNFQRETKSFKDLATPESYDQLKKELAEPEEK